MMERMSPLQQIVAHYESERASFVEAYTVCHEYGFVSDQREYFLMAVRCMRCDLERERNQWPTRVVIDLRGDAWFIAGMAGDMEAAWASEPCPLPWFAFERGKRLHIWPRERIRALTLRHGAVIAT